MGAVNGRSAHGSSTASGGMPVPDPWTGPAAASPAWDRVAAEYDAGALRRETDEAVRHFTALRERLRQPTDPWADPGLGERIARRAHSLLRNELKALDLSPAEAALLTLLPYLYQLRRARRATALTRVGPTVLGQSPAGGSPYRRDYETFLRGKEQVVRRAELSALGDRPDGRTEIGWWLFHRWLDASRDVRQLPTVRDLLGEAGVDPAGPLGRVLDAESVERLLSGPRRPPYELCGIERPSHLRPEHLVEVGYGPRQPVREQLVGCLFAVAQALALELTDLPDVIVKHIGVPDQVGMDRLNTTVAAASWTPPAGGEGLALHADCAHPAVAAALTAHAHHVDDLLRAVRRATAIHVPVAPLAALPVYACADGVREVDPEGHRVAATAIARFRLDEDRVRELLTGEPLYGDRSLAIRELYQNALDACRYQRARAQAHAQENEADSRYRGEIRFRQGVEDGRAYLECADNGVGMGEAELTGVFSQAGVRFVGQGSFHDEAARWQQLDPPVRLHPNSRFGIGVLSYFMLADEIRVTTRRDGDELVALITGPGNFFRVRRTGAAGTRGTTVRLYLRDGTDAPSCVDVLRRLLGIAEFRTTAEHGGRVDAWEPGVLHTRRALPYEKYGLDADGAFASWTAGDDGRDGQVVWCEYGGGLLVDGLLVEPGEQRGILTFGEGTTLRGAVVNLTGASSPERLSVDRLKVQDESVHVVVQGLLEQAAQRLAESLERPLEFDWLSAVASANLRLADVITTAATAADSEIALRGRVLRAGRTGFFTYDDEFTTDPAPADDLAYPSYRVDRHRRSTKDVPDEVLLWRLLAQRPNAELTALTGLFPEALGEFDADTREILPALPSDADYFMRDPLRADYPEWRPSDQTATVSTDAAIAIARRRGAALPEIAARAALLGCALALPALPEGEIGPADFALLTTAFKELSPRWPNGYVVPLGTLLHLHAQLGLSVVEAAQRLARYGFTVPDSGQLPLPTDPDVAALLRSGWSDQHWLDPQYTMFVSHLLKVGAALGRSVPDLVEQFVRYGFRTELDPYLASVDPPRTGNPDQPPVPPGRFVHTCEVLGLSVETARGRLRSAGRVPPTDLPPRIAPEDVRLLHGRLDPAEGAAWTVKDHIPLGHLLQAAAELGRTPDEVRERLRAYGLFPTDLELPTSWDAVDLRLLSGQFDATRPWRDDREPVPALVIAIGAHVLHITPREAADRLRRLGLAVPDETPALPTEDLELFGFGGRGVPTWIRIDQAVSLDALFDLSTTLGQAPRHVARRLAALGVSCPADLPEPGPHDGTLLREFRFSIDPNVRYGADEGGSIGHATRVAIINSSLQNKIPPREIAARLAAYRFDIEAGPLAEQMRAEDRELIGQEDRWLTSTWTVPLSRLLLAAQTLGRPLPEVYARCAELGLPAPTLDTVRAALARVPRRPAPDAENSQGSQDS